jgi:hypothetical protein
MPRTPIDYSKTIIYKLVCNDLSITDVYIGSTTSFKDRKRQHKCVCNNTNSKKYNEKKYVTIRANGNWDNWSMIEIEKYKCNDYNEARARERYWYELINANMNTYKPHITEDERIKQNLENSKKNYELNKKILNEKIKCLCGGCFSYASKQRHLKTKIHKCYLAQIKENHLENEK